jgi:hypothetical protein
MVPRHGMIVEVGALTVFAPLQGFGLLCVS